MSIDNENKTQLLKSIMLEEKTVRDPVLEDISLNFLECKIIDTEIFQRLRRIKQLGTVHLVFPGAEHSRFQHSLGTLHIVQILLNNVENNSNTKFTFGSNDIQNSFFKLVIRLGALLHDIYEFPLSHVLEKEGHIFGKQWKDKYLNIKIFGEESELFKAIWLCFKEQHEQLGLDKSLDKVSVDEVSKMWAATIISYIYKILTETDKKITEISKELFNDTKTISNIFNDDYLDAGGYMIRNTICADLLDYLSRDFYFCGVEKNYDKRFLTYAKITKKNGDIVFSYSLLDKRGKIKHSVLSSLFDVLELRYSLAEIVHTHRVKNSFSAMIIEAFNFYYQSLDDESKKGLLETLMTLGDDELLSFLRKENSKSKYILDYYYKHKNYKEFVLWDNWDLRSESILSEKGLETLMNAQKRLELEQILVYQINKYLTADKQIQDGDLLIYVMPNPENLWKELETFVIYKEEEGKSETSPLSKLAEENVLAYMSPKIRKVVKRIEYQRKLLMEKYKDLWKISLFMLCGLMFRS